MTMTMTMTTKTISDPTHKPLEIIGSGTLTVDSEVIADRYPATVLATAKPFVLFTDREEDIAGATVVNSGLIKNKAGSGSDKSAIHFNSIIGSVDATVQNSGMIRSVGGDAIKVTSGAGVLVNGTVAISNDQTGTISSISGQAINVAAGANPFATIVSNKGVIASHKDVAVHIAGNGVLGNSGEIYGGRFLTSDDTTANGDGVNIDRLATIVNSGLIKGVEARGFDANGERNLSEGVSIGGGTIENHTGGRILGADRGITVHSRGNVSGPSTITNYGLIAGTREDAIHFDSAADDVVINGGTIRAGSDGVAIHFGSGANTLKILDGSRIIGSVEAGVADNFNKVKGVLPSGDAYDTLDYSDYKHGVTVDLSSHKAAGVFGTVTGFDRVIGSDYKDDLRGDNGDNFLDGKGGGDYMAGRGGSDSYVVNSAGDIVDETENGQDAGGDQDVVRTAMSFDLGGKQVRGVVERLVLNGTDAIDGTGTDTHNQITGNDASNVLKGLGGDDVLYANGGNDWLYGGTGNDDLKGGSGADHFVFNTKLDAATNIDDILDFNASEGDKIYLSREIFGNLEATQEGASPALIIYNKLNGTIAYDADGEGGNDAVIFAHVKAGTDLSFDDFVLFG